MLWHSCARFSRTCSRRGQESERLLPCPVSEAAGSRGQSEAGQRLLAEAFAAVQRTEERYWEAELNRLQGDLLGQEAGGPVEDAEANFLRAIEVACSQQARSLELRAAMSLGRLWQEQGKRDDARTLLVPVYNWFAEGFDTADLQEAKALLDALIQHA